MEMTLLVLGLGNDLLGDDGIGLMAAEALDRRNIPGIYVVKSPLSGLYLVDLVDGFDDMIIVDSVIGEQPGKVVRLPLDELGPQNAPSAHYLGFAEALNLAKRAGVRIPNRVEILAMQIHGAQVLGARVSDEVVAGLPALIEEVIRVARLWGYEVGP